MWVDTLDTVVGAGMIGTCGDFDAEALVEGAESLEQNCSPLSDIIVTGHPQKRM